VTDPAQPTRDRPAHHQRIPFWHEIKDAVTLRAFLLVVGVLALQLLFIQGYIGAFHNPQPHRIPIAVAPSAGAPASAAGNATKHLNALPGRPLDARTVADEAGALEQLHDRDVVGGLVIAASGPDTVLTATAAGGAVADAVQTILERVEAQQHRHVAVRDAVPAGAQDSRGLSPFYLAVGWVVGGYLVASILAITAGGRPRNPRRSAIRLGSLALYSVGSGIGGVVIAGPLLSALPGHFWPLAGFGMLLVFGVGAFTMAIQALSGIIGVGIAVLLFVILGNPSAGGAYQSWLIPPFWRGIGPWLPPGAGTSAIRGIAYFGDAQVTTPVLVTIGYALAGAAVLLIVSGLRESAARHAPPPVTAPAGDG
jgi:hypothetical protein